MYLYTLCLVYYDCALYTHKQCWTCTRVVHHLTMKKFLNNFNNDLKGKVMVSLSQSGAELDN